MRFTLSMEEHGHAQPGMRQARGSLRCEARAEL